MALKWSNLAGTLLGYIRLGLGGVRLKNDSGSLSVRNAGDSADAVILPQSLGTGSRDGASFLRDDGVYARLNILQKTENGNYTLVLTDNSKHIYSANSGAQEITIPTNAAVPFPLGATITVVNNGTTDIDITTTSLVVYKAGTATAWPSGGVIGVRGMATFLKVDTDTWFVIGAGLS